MKILKYIAIALVSGLVALLVIVLLAAALAPKTYVIKRKIVIHATPEIIFSQVNNFKNWAHWNPWQKQDSSIKNTYSGPDAGVGCKSSWTSKNSGAGSMEIIASNAPNSILSLVKFNDFAALYGLFTFSAVDSGTEVAWIDSSITMSYPQNIFSLFAEKMIAPDLENGLRNLKNHIEAMPKWKLDEFKTDEQAQQHILGVMDSCKAEDIGKTLGGLYGEIGVVMKKNKLDFAGAPMAYYYSFTPGKVVLEAAIPVAKEVKSEGRVKSRTVAASRAASVSFFGDYGYMSEAMPVITKYLKDNKLEPNGPECDIYITDPGTVKDKMLVETKIVFTVK